MVDLASLRFPVDFDVPRLGRVAIEPMTGTFGNWARGLKADDDALAMTRQMLALHGRVPASEAPPSADAIALLSLADLDQAASGFVDASGGLLKSEWIGEMKRGERHVRRRSADEAYDLSAREGETGAIRLRRVLLDWVQDQADRNEALLARMEPPGGKALKAMLESQSATNRLFAEHKRLFASVDTISAITQAQDALRIPVVRDALAESFAATSALAKASAGFSPDWMTTASAAGRMAATSGLHAKIFRDMFEASTALVEARQFASILGQDPAFGRDLVGEGASMIAARKVFVGLDSLTAFSRGFADQYDFMKSINRSFHLGLSAAAIAALTTIQTPDLGLSRLAIDAATWMPPGYQLAASLGLSGAVPRGVAAEVLRFYGAEDDTDAAAVFDVTRDTARSVDNGPLTDARVETLLERMHEVVSKEVARERDPVRRTALLAILSFILALYSTALATATFYLDVRADHRDEAQARAQAQVAADPAKLGPRLDHLSQQLQTLKAAPQAGDRHLRYIYAAAPLRADPDARGLVLRVVYPDQVLRIEDERGPWVKAAVFDYHGDVEVTGWINRAHLRLKPLDN